MLEGHFVGWNVRGRNASDLPRQVEGDEPQIEADSYSIQRDALVIRRIGSGRGKRMPGNALDCLQCEYRLPSGARCTPARAYGSSAMR